MKCLWEQTSSSLYTRSPTNACDGEVVGPTHIQATPVSKHQPASSWRSTTPDTRLIPDLFLPLQILIDVIAIVQVVGDGSVDFLQAQGGILLRERRRRADSRACSCFAVRSGVQLAVPEWMRRAVGEKACTGFGLRCSRAGFRLAQEVGETG